MLKQTGVDNESDLDCLNSLDYIQYSPIITVTLLEHRFGIAEFCIKQ